MYEKRPTYFCEECHTTFQSKRALKAHNEAKHPPEEDSDSGLGPEFDKEGAPF